ncbi:MAG: hypothetical protein R2791_14570 [Saprospiraceae bacterium]|nr:hypothetical protein [Saprospiraceae bacterium]MCB0543221.1 hypothetical protein [Saprospiraceae bacterium]MCB9354719.1 hypothetical protein [Lewinellaceae bacterium]
MKHHNSLSEILQNLNEQGYLLAEEQLANFPEENLRSDDWRLDSVEEVLQESGKALVIAVSSASRHLKLIFVEALSSLSDFSPITLLRRLFPMRPRANYHLYPVPVR